MARPKGSLNKVTRNAKEMLEMAADELGGLKALVAWGREKPDAFWPVWAKLLPKDIAVKQDGPFEVTVRFAHESRKVTSG